LTKNVNSSIRLTQAVKDLDPLSMWSGIRFLTHAHGIESEWECMTHFVWPTSFLMEISQY